MVRNWYVFRRLRPGLIGCSDTTQKWGAQQSVSMNADDGGDVDAYTLNSKYRRAVLAHLAEAGRATPKGIADDAEIPRSHVSRALGELREKGVVELLVSEERSVGRYYGLTEVGEGVWDRLKDEIRQVDWSVTAPETDAERALVDAAESATGSSLRTVTLYDGDAARMLYADGVVSQYTDEELEQGVRTLVFEHTLDVELFDDQARSELLTFSEFSLLRVQAEDDLRVAVTVDADRDCPVQTLTTRLVSALESPAKDW